VDSENFQVIFAISQLLYYFLNDCVRTYIVAGSFSYRVTEESLMEHLGTNMHEACPRIDKECRLVEKDV
jgi:hypothetical protein